MIIEMLS